MCKDLGIWGSGDLGFCIDGDLCAGPAGLQAGKLKTWETETLKGRIQNFRFPASQLPLGFSARRSSSQKLRSSIAPRAAQLASNRRCRDAKPAPPIPTPPGGQRHARWTMASRRTDTIPTALALCHHGPEPEDSSPAPHRCGRT